MHPDTVSERKHYPTRNGSALMGKPGSRPTKEKHINWSSGVTNSWHHPPPHGQDGQGRNVRAILNFTSLLFVQPVTLYHRV